VNSGGGEDDVVDVPGPCVCDVPVQRTAKLVAPAEFTLVSREWTPASLHARPRCLDVDIEVHDEDVQLLEQLPALDCSAAERDHGGRATIARVRDERSLQLAKRRLTTLVEDFGNRAFRTLDLLVDVEEVASEAAGDLGAERRLPRAHKADQREVPV
jgi:hypothetical protein